MQARLIEIEKQIVAVTGNDTDNSDKWLSVPERKEQVRLLLEERNRILNDMFEPTAKNMSRFQSVNDSLYTLTKQLYARVAALGAKLPIIMEGQDFDDYEIRGTLRYAYNSEESVLSLADDEYYSSNFPLMIKLISDLSYGTAEENIEDISCNSMPLDDGQSWNEYPFRGRKEFEDIVICHSAHQLTGHQLYSIPDLIRLNDFWSEVNFTLQSLTPPDATQFY